MHCNVSASVETKKPLILNVQKWNSILKQITKNDDILEQTQNEKNYLQYLKEESAEMTSKWKNAISKGVDIALVEERKQRVKQRAMEDAKKVQAIKENDDKLRYEKIQRAQQMIERRKTGPLQLERAAMLSEVLKAREIHSNIKKKFEEEREEFEKKELENYNLKNITWVEQHQNRVEAAVERNNEYKAELFNCIKVNKQNKIECVKTLMEGERKMIEQHDLDVRAQIERERIILQRKKEIMRKNALEAMKMVEQRRLREKLENNVESAINNLYNKNRVTIKQLRNNTKKQTDENRLMVIDDASKNLAALKKQQDERCIDDECAFNKAVDELNLKLDLQEQEKIKKERKLKAAKINYYMLESQRRQEEKKQKLEEFKWAVANRLKNEEINTQFHFNELQQRIKKKQEQRQNLDNQIEENRQLKAKIVDKCDLTTEYANDDKFFFRYANKLMEDAKNKSRPILPFIKAIENYSRTNNLNFEDLPIDENLKCTAFDKEKPILKYNLCELKQLDPTAKLNVLS